MARSRLVMGWCGVALLTVACGIGSLRFPKNFLWFFESSVSFVPDLFSGFIAALALFPLWRKGELATPFRGALSLAALIPAFYLASVLVNIALGNAGLGILKLPSAWILIVVLLLANINVQRYAELAAIVLLFLVIWNVHSASDVMGFLGFPFFLAAALGLVLVFDQHKIFAEVAGRDFQHKA